MYFAEDCGLDEVLIDFSDQQFAKPYKEWSVDDVCSWVGQIGMSQYEENFKMHAIDGTELLTLSHETLEKDLKIGESILLLIDSCLVWGRVVKINLHS
jgi:hypothetical protein